MARQDAGKQATQKGNKGKLAQKSEYDRRVNLYRRCSGCGAGFVGGTRRRQGQGTSTRKRSISSRAWRQFTNVTTNTMCHILWLLPTKFKIPPGEKRSGLIEDLKSVIDGKINFKIIKLFFFTNHCYCRQRPHSFIGI